MWVVVTYDIADDKRRNKLARLLEGFGVRVQESVFECELDPKVLEQMVTRATKLIKWEEDSIRLYQLPSVSFLTLKILGVGQNVISEWKYVGDRGASQES